MESERMGRSEARSKRSPRAWARSLPGTAGVREVLSTMQAQWNTHVKSHVWPLLRVGNPVTYAFGQPETPGRAS